MIQPKRSRKADLNLTKSLNAKIRNLAKTAGIKSQQLRYHIIFECFLNRVFTADGSGWALKGGAALLIRNSEGRFTRDIDMARSTQWHDLQEVEDEFERILQQSASDPFTFHLEKIETVHDIDPTGYKSPGIRAHIIARIGAVQFEQFSIDVTVSRSVQAPETEVEVTPIIGKLLNNSEETKFFVRAIAIESHLADKVCAMYEQHDNGPSTRYRDLADITTIVATQNFSLQKLSDSLRHESARRKMFLPEKLESPAPEWEYGYHNHAKENLNLPDNLKSLENALDYAGKCLNPVLAKSLTEDFVWDFKEGKWMNQ